MSSAHHFLFFPNCALPRKPTRITYGKYWLYTIIFYFTYFFLYSSLSTDVGCNTQPYIVALFLLFYSSCKY